jgi:hypothetical protein
MADLPVTKQEVFEAADLLAELGIMPSILSVRDALGNRGSESTIVKHLRVWKTALLTRKASGCVFCESCQKENEELKEQVIKYKSLAEQIKNNMRAFSPAANKPEAEYTRINFI